MVVLRGTSRLFVGTIEHVPSARTVGRSLTVALAAAVFLAGCASPQAIPTPTQVGAPGYRFSVSFLQPPRERTFTFEKSRYQPQYGTGVATRRIWTGGQVTVWVDSLTSSVPARRIAPFLRSYLPTQNGGRITTRFGRPAATESVPCTTPAGACPGTISGFVVLKGDTIYDLFTHQGDASTARAIIESFRLTASPQKR